MAEPSDVLNAARAALARARDRVAAARRAYFEGTPADYTVAREEYYEALADEVRCAERLLQASILAGTRGEWVEKPAIRRGG